MKNLIPFSPLILYSKGWISFRHKKPEWDLFRQLKEVLRMCGYYPNKNPVSQVIFGFDCIKEFFQSKGEELPRAFTSLHSFWDEVTLEKSSRQCSIEEAIIYVILGELGMLDIREYKVSWLEYRKARFTLSTYHPGMTYKEQQDKFLKTFNVCTKVI